VLAVRAAQEFGFVDLLDASDFAFSSLDPTDRDDQGGRLLRTAVGHVASRALDQVRAAGARGWGAFR